MEKKDYKYELGNFYGSRVSKNGVWLNLQIVTHIHGQEWIITCPVRLAKEYDETGGKKPYARLEKACSAEGVEYVDKAVIANLPVYEDKKPEAQTEEIEIPDFI